MEPNEYLVEIIQEGIDDAMDLDTNSATWAKQAAWFLTTEINSKYGVNLPLLIAALDDYVQLQQDGNIDPAGRYSASDVAFGAHRLEQLFTMEKPEA